MFSFKPKFPFTRQLESKDCGPACLQMICKYYKRFYEMEYLREICGIKKEGISVYDFIKASEKIGLKSQAYKLSYWKFRNEVPLPCVVHWRNHHFIVVYKITSKYIYASDPQNGLCRFSLRDFANGWLVYKHNDGNKTKKRGVCIVSEPTNDFLQDDARNQNAGQQSVLNAFNFIWSYMAPYKGTIIKVMFLLIAVTALNMLFPIITQNIIDVGIPSKDYDFITVMLISSIILTVSLSLSSWIQQLMTTHFSVHIKLSMQSDFIIKMFRLPMNFFETRLMGDIMQRNTDYDRLESFIMTSMFNFMLSILQFIVFGIILFYYNRMILWAFTIGSLLYCGWVLFFWNIRKKMDIRYFTYLARNQSQWIEMLSNMTDIKSFNYGTSKRWQWEKVQIKLFKTRIKLLNVGQLQELGSSLINMSKNLFIIYLAAISVTSGDMSMGMLIAVQYIVGQLSAPMEGIIQFITSIQMANISYMRVQEIINKPVEDASAAKDFKPELVDFSKDIVIKNVYFKYSVNDDYVLKNISCILPRGKMIAVVGESGCGKSTIIKLLAGLYVPTSGNILVGNMKLTSFPMTEWRNRIGLLSQDSGLLNETILDNIVFGREFDAERLRQVVELANIKSDIEKKPMGYDTKIQENGKGVSEGQKQRILFARAIYSHPEYLLLDELTSALDSNNELSIIETIKKLPYHPTTLLVAHRLSSVRRADLIIVLKGGNIVEMGTHNNLYMKKGAYYSLFKSQEMVIEDLLSQQ
ncbi:MAG: peptidase domain-containing ABC transporter [Prevotella sp.]|nr:peptidase domain-containing ABC transporter [Prevotella sp.]